VAKKTRQKEKNNGRVIGYSWIWWKPLKVSDKLAWKRGDGWVQFNPPRGHPQYEEWMKLKQKEKEKENADEKVQER